MKTVNLIERGEIDGKAVLKTVLGNAMVSGGARLEEIRSRVKLLDKLDQATGSLELEDAEFDALKSIVSAYPFGVANADLLAVLDAIVTPAEPAKGAG